MCGLVSSGKLVQAELDMRESKWEKPVKDKPEREDSGLVGF